MRRPTLWRLAATAFGASMVHNTAWQDLVASAQVGTQGSQAVPREAKPRGQGAKGYEQYLGQFVLPNFLCDFVALALS